MKVLLNEYYLKLAILYIFKYYSITTTIVKKSTNWLIASCTFPF